MTRQPLKRSVGGWPLALMCTVTVCACGGGSTTPSPPNATSGSNAPSTTAPSPTLPTGCDANPCTLRAGTYVLGDTSVIPGLTLSVPAGGWQTSAGGNDQGAFDLIPPGHPNDRLFIWDDLVAVKSTGAGHGTTQLTNVGRTPDALVSWMGSNPDLLVLAQPAPATIGAGIKSTTLDVGVSPAAQYGDPSCPSNPRCADLFTNPALWGKNEFFGVAGNEQVRLYLAAIKVAGQPQTVFVTLDAPGGAADLGALSTAAAPILDSIRLPEGALAG
jgi:hypothetical protein